ncbi:AI-2E family transporter [Psychrobium sp. MM17-31]|uniref:AI-2E family transporter n=1 Tax=Psychrobium sp. MM17-31 TaxID=2917758 RepID=UPI0031BAECF2
MPKTQLSPSLKTALMLASVVIILAGIKTASPVIVPFILSVFIAIICNPALNWLTTRRVPKGVAIGLIISFVVLAGMWLANLVGKAVNDFSSQLPAYQAQLTERFGGLSNQLAEYNFPVELNQLTEYFDPGAAMNVVTMIVGGFGGVMANLFLILLTVIFMLTEASSFPKKLHVALDDADMRMAQIDQFLLSVNQYLAIKTMVSMATGTIIGLVLWAIGLDYWVLWGVLAFLLNYIPNIGSIIAAVPAVLLAVIQLGIGWAGGVVALYLVVNVVMGNAVEPRFLGKGLGLSTLVVFLSLIFWGWLLGTVGMLLSVPLTMILKIGLESNNSTRWLALLLGGEEQSAS